MNDSAINRNLLRRKGNREKQNTLQEQMDLEWVMSDPRGRRFMQKLLRRCGVYKMNFAGEQTHWSAFHEGERNVGNEQLAILLSEQGANYVLMMQEDAASKVKVKETEEKEAQEEKAKTEAGDEEPEPETP